MAPRFVFFGTTDLAAYLLRHLVSHKFSVAAVVTRPDRKQGRSLRLGASPVKQYLLNEAPHLPLFQPERVSTPEFVATLAALQAELFLVVAFGEILKASVLDLPPLGSLNVHPSLLPRYRGAAPIQRALWHGELETGVTIQEMALQMDAGDIVATTFCPIPEEMNCGELKQQLMSQAAPLLVDVLEHLEERLAHKVSQDESQVTFAPKILPHEERVNWTHSARQIHNQIRALAPQPGAWTARPLESQQQRIKLLASRVPLDSQPGLPEFHPSEPLGACAVVGPSLYVRCGEGMLEILTLQPEGKKAMPAADFVRGMRADLRFA